MTEESGTRWQPAKATFRRYSVRTCLILLVVACLLPGVVGAGIFFVREYKANQAQLAGNRIFTARALVQTVDSYLMQTRVMAETLATDEAILRGDFAAFRRRASEALARTGIGTNVVLIDESAQQVFNLREAPGSALPRSSNPQGIRKVFASGEPLISDLRLIPQQQRPVTTVYVPVKSGGKVIYVLSIGIMPRQFNEILNSQGLPADWVAAIFDTTGTTVARTHAPAQSVGQKGQDELLRRIGESAEGVLDTTTREGIRVLGVFSRSPVSGWSVAIGMPRESLETPLAHFLSALTRSVALLFVVGLALAWIVGERIAHSFRALIAPAAALGSGGKPALPAVAVKEAAEVAMALGKAADLLGQRDAELQVASRTLQASEEKYRTLFANMAEGFALLELIYDEQGCPSDVRVLEANDAFYLQSGLPREVLGRSAREYLPGLEGYWLEAYHRVVSTGESIRLQNYNADTRRDYDLCAFRPAPGRLAFVFRDITEQKAMEKALRESVNDLSRLIASLPGMVWSCTREGKMEFMSQQWLDYTGNSFESQLVQGNLAPIHPQDKERVSECWKEALATHQAFHAEYRLRRHDGVYRWFKSRGSAQLDKDGQVIRWLGIIIDIEDLKCTQEALLVSRGELMEAQRLARLGNWFWRRGADEIVFSQSLRDICGLDMQPVPAKWRNVLGTDTWKRVKAAAQRAFRNGTGFDLELPVRHGKTSGAWIHLKGETIRDSHGEIIALRGTAQDITERKEAQRALHESNARFQAVFEQAAVGIARVALDGRWLEPNGRVCSIVGYPPAELMNLKFQDITHPPDLEADLELVDMLLAGRTSSYSLEKRYIRKDGNLVWTRLTASLVRTPGGEPDYFISVLEDIQRRKETEAALETVRRTHLEQLERQVAERTAALRDAYDHLEERVQERTEEVRRLAAEVTFAEERERQALARDLHDDLGQLLHVVKIKLGLLGREDLPGGGEALVKEIGALIADASRQVRSLTSQLSPPILSTLGLPAALRWLGGEIQQIYGLSVSCRTEVLDCGLPLAQSAILFRAARELLINAAKHSGSERAWLVLVRESEHLRMTVEDCGVGIRVPGEALAGGKGFGLASIRERISFLGGTMSIEKAAAGGARIVLRMPVGIGMKRAEVTG